MNQYQKEYCDLKGSKEFNKYNNNDYTKFLEKKLNSLQPLCSKSDQKQFLITSFDKMDKTHITMLELAQFDDLADKILLKEDLKCHCCNGTGKVEGEYRDEIESCLTCNGRGVF